MNLGWASINWPLLIFGMAALLTAVCLPVVAGARPSGRGRRMLLIVAGAAAMGVSLWRVGGTDSEVPGGRSGGDRVEAGLAPSQCVEWLARHMAQRDATSSQAASVAPPPGRRAVGLVSGSSTGTYHAVAEDLVRLARENGLPLFNRETQGSLDNLRMLADPQENAALGMAQADILEWLRSSPDAALRRRAEQLRLVWPLYREEIHLLARREIMTLDDLRGAVLVTAASSQGSRHTAENLLRLSGVDRVELRTLPSAAEATCEVLSGRAQAVLFVAGKPAAHLASLEVLRDHPARPLEAVKLLALSPPSADSVYEPAEVGPSDYAWLERPVKTLAVRAVMMAYDFSARRNAYQRMRCDQLRRMGQVLRTQLPRLRALALHPKSREVDFLRSLPGWPAERCAAQR